MKTIEIGHRSMTVAYEDVGTGLPVVLLHAFPFDREMWTPQFGPLAAAGELYGVRTESGEWHYPRGSSTRSGGRRRPSPACSRTFLRRS